MPIYEFGCDHCGHEFESLQRVSDPLPDTCPECGEHQVRKKISAAGFRLKGGGWYETDFKSGNKKNVSGSESGKATDSTGSSDGGSSEAGSDSSSSGSKSSDSGAKNSDKAAKSTTSESKTPSKSSKTD